MECKEWKEMMVAELYGELNPGDKALLDRHLSGCDHCRRELDELEAGRQILQEAEPLVPAAPRVVVLPSPATRIRSWWSFAAGFAAASLLLAAGLVTGWTMAGNTFGDRPASPQAINTDLLPAGLVYQEDLDAALRSNREQLHGGFAEPLPDTLSRQYLDNRLTTLASNMDQRRRDDLQFLLEQILASEMRSGVAIDETQKAVRYLAVANNPGMSEW